jgi:hypothetical protein
MTKTTLLFWQKFVKLLFLVLIIVFIAMSVYPLSSFSEGLVTAIAPVGLRMSQNQAGGPSAVYKAQQEANMIQTNNNLAFK